MIFVTLGTHGDPMPRLIEALAALAATASRLGPFEIQHGSSRLPDGWAGAAMYAPAHLEAMVARADVVVTHGGPATIAMAREMGKVPIVVPRMARHGEHVDDHQVWYSDRLAEAQEILLVRDVTDLGDVIQRYATLAASLPPPKSHDSSPAVRRVAEIVEALLGQDE